MKHFTVPAANDFEFGSREFSIEFFDLGGKHYSVYAEPGWIMRWFWSHNDGRLIPKAFKPFQWTKLARKVFSTQISVFLMLLLFVVPAHAHVTDHQAIQAIVGEAANQGYDGMTAVGEVIRRRDSVSGVYGHDAMRLRFEPPWVWAQAALAWERSEYSNLSKGATLFENIYAFGFPKSWDRQKVVCVAVIRDHWFFTEV